MNKLVLKPKKEKSVRNYHPWIFSGAIAKTPENIQNGDWVEVCDAQQNTLGFGHYYKGSIAVRMLVFGEKKPAANFWENALHKALRQRLAWGFPSQFTNCFRLVHGEADDLPGLVVDIYDRTAVVQCHTEGMLRSQSEWLPVLKNLPNLDLELIYDKSSENDAAVLWHKNADFRNENIVLENNLRFKVNWETGQKTGFFLDQRLNRALLGTMTEGKKVLNAFAYSGGFSVYALAGKAQMVHSVDVSEKAIALANENVALNFPQAKHEGIVADCFQFLRQMPEKYDVYVLDPPAFAKHRSAVKQAAQGYKQINLQVFRQAPEGSILFTFSCSQVIDSDLFRKIIFAAAADAHREVKILYQLHQPADHPISIYHPEGEYLKGLVLYIGGVLG
ncbi:MAG: class I SAM-dependent rRNA methyltransferase [Chitinophagales bacterium]|nr:class I SAM-dependent rRNA methyltransferase [Bacteroidota bacterium]MCB9042243.1 class I SAM-dependent rRNA methyltransferase [Chitinophagales bacterium]